MKKSKPYYFANIFFGVLGMTFLIRTGYSLVELVTPSGTVDLRLIVEVVLHVSLMALMAMMLKSNSLALVIYADKLEVNYFFGLLRSDYAFDTLAFSNYSGTRKTALLEFPNGSQLTIRASNFSNFEEMVDLLLLQIEKRASKSWFANKLTIIVTVIFVLAALASFSLAPS